MSGQDADMAVGHGGSGPEISGQWELGCCGRSRHSQSFNRCDSETRGGSMTCSNDADEEGRKEGEGGCDPAGWVTQAHPFAAVQHTSFCLLTYGNIKTRLPPQHGQVSLSRLDSPTATTATTTPTERYKMLQSCGCRAKEASGPGFQPGQTDRAAHPPHSMGERALDGTH